MNNWNLKVEIIAEHIIMGRLNFINPIQRQCNLMPIGVSI